MMKVFGLQTGRNDLLLIPLYCCDIHSTASALYGDAEAQIPAGVSQTQGSCNS